ncbi:hypothetical protein, partial [Vibrio cidicii]|uniref:hypothetical protein n=1 Tax=Vibrio cidicii TaxID=1763883 RepID=UPI0018C2EC7F
FSTDTEINYLIRKGDVAGNRFDYLLSILLELVRFCLVIIAISYCTKRAVVLSFLALWFLVDVKSGVGRTNLLLCFSIIVLYVTNFRTFTFSRVIFVLFFLSIPVMLIMKSIIYKLATTGTISFDDIDFLSVDLSMYISNFAHPVISMVNAERLVAIVGDRYFLDILNGFAFYFRIFGFDVDYSLTYYNTFNLMSVYESIIPPGYLAFGYVQLSFLGVFISGIIYRFLGVLSKRTYIYLGCNNESVKFYLVFISANTFYHGDPRILTLTYVAPLVFILLFHNKFIKRSC